MNIFENFIRHAKRLLYIYATGILFFTILRLILVLVNYTGFLQIGDTKWLLLAEAFLMGLRFDTVISCYILSLPVVILCILILVYRITKPVLQLCYGYLAIVYSVAF